MELLFYEVNDENEKDPCAQRAGACALAALCACAWCVWYIIQYYQGQSFGDRMRTNAPDEPAASSSSA